MKPHSNHSFIESLKSVDRADSLEKKRLFLFKPSSFMNHDEVRGWKCVKRKSWKSLAIGLNDRQRYLMELASSSKYINNTILLTVLLNN